MSSLSEEEKQRLKQAAAERKKKLLALSPQFVDVIKLGQTFTRVNENGELEDVFVWYTSEVDTAGSIHWEPIVGVSDVTFMSSPTDADVASFQPRNKAPERTVSFTSVSDIYRGRSEFVAKHVPDAKPKLCLTFAVFEGCGHGLHLISPTRTQMEAWVYGIQHILKENGHDFFEADQQADVRETAIFEKYTAKLLLNAILKHSPDVQGLRLSATLSTIARGQVFTRFLSPEESTEINLYFANDGKKGILFWGSRSQPEGFLPLRTVSDMWLGKHGHADSSISAGFETAQCAVLKSKKVELCIAAPTSAIMTQWIYGINSLLSASPELLAEINNTDVGAFPMAVPSRSESTKQHTTVQPAATNVATNSTVISPTPTQATLQTEVPCNNASHDAIASQAALMAEKVLQNVEERNEEFSKALQTRLALAGSTLDNDTQAKVSSQPSALSQADEALSAARALRQASLDKFREQQVAAAKALEAVAAAFAASDVVPKEKVEAQTKANGLVTMYEVPAFEYSDDSDDDDEDDGATDNTDPAANTFEKKRGRKLSLFSQLGINKTAEVRSAFEFDQHNLQHESPEAIINGEENDLLLTAPEVVAVKPNPIIRRKSIHGEERWSAALDFDINNFADHDDDPNNAELDLLNFELGADLEFNCELEENFDEANMYLESNIDDDSNSFEKELEAKQGDIDHSDMLGNLNSPTAESHYDFEVLGSANYSTGSEPTSPAVPRQPVQRVPISSRPPIGSSRPTTQTNTNLGSTRVPLSRGGVPPRTAATTSSTISPPSARGTTKPLNSNVTRPAPSSSSSMSTSSRMTQAQAPPTNRPLSRQPQDLNIRTPMSQNPTTTQTKMSMGSKVAPGSSRPSQELSSRPTSRQSMQPNTSNSSFSMAPSSSRMSNPPPTSTSRSTVASSSSTVAGSMSRRAPTASGIPAQGPPTTASARRGTVLGPPGMSARSSIPK